MRRKIVAGNWKMNCTFDEACALASEIAAMIKDEVTNDVGVVLAPPFLFLNPVTRLITGTKNLFTAAQNCSSEKAGAYTGEVSAAMIASVHAQYVIIGHSERRSYFNETNNLLAKKVDCALENSLKVIFCCGETKAQRESNKQFETVKTQIEEGVFHLDKKQFEKIIIAYEPVWAIGTGLTASAEQAQEMHAFIRNLISEKFGNDVSSNTSLLYGGSCNEKNAEELFALPDVDGGLIGGASLKSRSFLTIIKSMR